MKLNKHSLIAIALAIGWATGVAANQPQSAVISERARDLGKEVRCPVCNGQSVFDSDAPEALSIQSFILKSLTAGHSDERIRTELAAHFGDDILFRPNINLHTLLLWLFPILVTTGGVILWYRARS